MHGVTAGSQRERMRGSSRVPGQGRWSRSHSCQPVTVTLLVAALPLSLWRLLLLPLLPALPALLQLLPLLLLLLLLLLPALLQLLPLLLLLLLLLRLRGRHLLCLPG